MVVRYTRGEDLIMAQTLSIPPPGFDELSVEEQVDYVQTLWDRIAAHPSTVPIPDWHRHVLAERLAAYTANPTEGRSWDEVREELLQRLRNDTGQS